MSLQDKTLVLTVAFIADLVFKDPDYSLHPVRLIGATVSWVDRTFNKGYAGYLSGAFAYLIVAGFWTALGCLFSSFWWAHLFFVYSFIAPTQLWKEVISVAGYLRENRLSEARKRLSMLITRDVSSMDGKDIVRCSIETLAENTSDAFFGPVLFYCVGGLPLLFLYKVTETGDSMVGYRTERYARFGYLFARADDLLNLIPARITFLFALFAAIVLELDWKRAFVCGLRYAGLRDSPNAGWPESAFAWAVGIRLGGLYSYFGRKVFKVPLGEDLFPVDVHQIYRAIAVSFLCCVLLILVLWVVSTLL